MSDRFTVVTRKMLWRHNLKCVGRGVLWMTGAAAVYFVSFVFFWLVVSLVTGDSALGRWVMLFSGLSAAGIFWWGHRYLQKHGPQDWEKIAQQPDRRMGMRISRLSQQDYGQVGQGMVGLILMGPRWLVKGWDEGRAWIRVKDEEVERLEAVRRHFAARDAWVPMKDFAKFEVEIWLLAKLELLAIREIFGEWHFHLTVRGLGKGRIVSG